MRVLVCCWLALNCTIYLCICVCITVRGRCVLSPASGDRTSTIMLSDPETSILHEVELNNNNSCTHAVCSYRSPLQRLRTIRFICSSLKNITVFFCIASFSSFSLLWLGSTTYLYPIFWRVQQLKQCHWPSFPFNSIVVIRGLDGHCNNS